MILSCPLKFKGRVPTSFGVALYTWVGFVYLGSTLLSSGGAISWGAPPVSVCTPSWLVRFPREDSFLVELTLTACGLKFGCEEKTESLNIQYINFPWTPFFAFSVGGGTPPSPMPAALLSRDPL